MVTGQFDEGCTKLVRENGPTGSLDKASALERSLEQRNSI